MKRFYVYIQLCLVIYFFAGCMSTQTTPSNHTYVPLQPLTYTYQPPQQCKSYTPPQEPEYFYHTVKKGENVTMIARLYNVPAYEIARLNRLPDTNYLEQGQMLLINKLTEEELNRQKAIASIPEQETFQMPVKGKVAYSYRTEFQGTRLNGIIIDAPYGTNIVATKSGYVSYVGDQVRGMGKMIIIDHRNNFQSVYAYNSKNLVTQGSLVTQGDVIARVGKSGRAESTSLHFEIRNNSNPVDPQLYIK